MNSFIVITLGVFGVIALLSFMGAHKGKRILRRSK